MSTTDQAHERGAFTRWLAEHSRELAPVATLASLVIFFSVATKGFFSTDTFLSILRQTPTRAIVGTGLTFVLLCGEIDLSVAMIATFASCQVGVLYDWILRAHPALLSAPAGDGVFQITAIGVAFIVLLPILSGLLMGLVSGTLTVWSRLPSFIITLAMMEVAYGLGSYLTRGAVFKVPRALATVANGSLALPGGAQLAWSVLVAGAVMLLAHGVLAYTRFGRYVYMTGGNREAARLAGVRTGLVTAVCLAISGVCGAMGGLMNAGWLNSAGINQNEKLLLEAVACVVLGGTSLFGGEGGIRNTFIGVLAFTVLYVGLGYVAWVDEFLRRFVMGLVLLAALILNGELGKLRER